MKLSELLEENGPRTFRLTQPMIPFPKRSTQELVDRQKRSDVGRDNRSGIGGGEYKGKFSFPKDTPMYDMAPEMQFVQAMSQKQGIKAQLAGCKFFERGPYEGAQITFYVLELSEESELRARMKAKYNNKRLTDDDDDSGLFMYIIRWAPAVGFKKFGKSPNDSKQWMIRTTDSKRKLAHAFRVDLEAHVRSILPKD